MPDEALPFGKLNQDLIRQGQETLIQFLLIQLDFAFVMCEMLDVVQNADHRDRIARDVHKALDTVYRFEERVRDTANRENIHKEAIALEDLIASLEAHP